MCWVSLASRRWLMRDDDLILDDGATVRPGWTRLWVAEDWCLQWSFLNVMPGLDDLRLSLMAL